ncbi:MAG: outer membrane beta-barrel protein, partial [Telluria sp.]
QAGGLEFTLRGKLMPRLTLNASGNLAYTEQRIANADAALDAKRSAPSFGGNARLRYELANGGQMQLSVIAQGKSLSRQGYREPNATVNVSLRHVLTPTLSLVMNVTDIFDTNKIENITDTDLLKETSVRRADGRVMYVGLSYRFGGVPPRNGQGGGRRRAPQE